MVEHVGSTAVPGLAAKPVIDMLLVLEDPAKEALYVPPLEAAGYRLVIREPEWNQHRVFKGPDTDINLHIFPEGNSEVQRMFAFRDLLRSNPDEDQRYAAVKRELAQRKWEYIQDYADAKTSVVEEILARGGAS